VIEFARYGLLILQRGNLFDWPLLLGLRRTDRFQ
jgi:hypothetical protein